jgi:hypothetical protein
VHQARAFLLERFLVDFPWTGKADRANYLALLVSPALRPFLRCLTPFGIVTASMPGSGKTILTAAIGLSYGQRVLSWPDSDDELRKSITAVMAEPVGEVVFDNLAEGAVIDSPILARLITDHTWSDRRLGSSSNVAYPNDRLWLATGNNLAVGGDMASRTVLVRLDPDMPHPEERSGFTIPDLPQWIMEQANRRTLLRHVLTLVVDWCANGAPQAEGVTMRQFTPWARAVRGFLAHHEIEGFLTNIDQVRAVDETDQEWSAFLARWWHLRKDTPLLANELLASAQAVMTDEDVWQGTFITGRNGRIRTPSPSAGCCAARSAAADRLRRDRPGHPAAGRRTVPEPPTRARLAPLRPQDLDHRAVLHAMDQVLRSTEIDEMAPIRDLDLYDQSEDMAAHVPAGIAARTLYTLLCRACETEPQQLTHRWIAETTARAVRTYRAPDAVNAQRGRTATAARSATPPTTRP